MKFKPHQKVMTPYGWGIIRLIQQPVAGLKPWYVVEFDYTATPKIFTEDELSHA